MSTTKDNATAISIERRVRRFYDLLNKGEVEKCYLMIDPEIRKQPESVTRLQYATSARTFRKKVGQLTVVDVVLQLHVDQPSPLYGGRDFAVGTVVCRLTKDKQIEFQERWIRDGKSWYTRSTGFVA